MSEFSLLTQSEDPRGRPGFPRLQLQRQRVKSNTYMSLFRYFHLRPLLLIQGGIRLRQSRTIVYLCGSLQMLDQGRLLLDSWHTVMRGRLFALLELLLLTGRLGVHPRIRSDHAALARDKAVLYHLSYVFTSAVVVLR